MQISRRTALRLGLSLAACRLSSADAGEDPHAKPAGFLRVAAEVAGSRPAVVLLHGSRGIELNPEAYRGHADALAAHSIDAILFSYFDDSDRNAPDHAKFAYVLKREANKRGHSAAPRTIVRFDMGFPLRSRRLL